MIKIFISHSSTDKELARKIVADLEEMGFNAWLDEREIFVGDSIIDKVAEGLKDSNFILVLLTKNSVQANWVLEEVKIATHRRLSEDNIHFLPVLAEECEIPTYLTDLKYANLTKDYELGLRSIIQAVDKISGIDWTYEETPKYAEENLIRRLKYNRNYSLLAIDNSLAFYYTDNYDQISKDKIKINIPKWAQNILSEDLKDPTKEELLSVIPDYFDDSAEYLKTRIQVDSTGFFNCKVGIIKIEKPIRRLNQPLTLTVIPLSYWVVREFNRRILRYPNDAALRELKEKNLNHLTEKRDSVIFKCPSALYVELAILTADGMVCILEKNPQLSVLAHTNRGKWTCTVEEGLEWNKDVTSADGTLNINSVISRCFELELSIFREFISDVRLTGVALEYTHLNTALTGFCVLSLNSGELIARIEDSEDFQLKYRFVPIDQIENEFFENSKDNLLWHPTARLRMYSVKKWVAKEE